MPIADSSNWIYRFGEFTLNTASGLLLKNGDEIKLRRQSFEILCMLLENRGHLVSREDLHAEVWRGKSVTDDSLAQCLTEIRRALGDADRTMIRTIPRRGYLLAADVDVVSVDSVPPQPLLRTQRRSWMLAAAATLTVVLVLLVIVQLQESSPQAPYQSISNSSVAVLPFVNMSADLDDEYFSDGLAETLMTKLAQVRDIKVAARTSSFAFKGRNTDIRAIGATLGVAHVLEGSVMRAGDRVRITAQLIRTKDGFHVWSENYDRELTDIFVVQDDIAAKVGVKLLAHILNPSEAGRARAIDTEDFDAYDFYLRARAEMSRASFDDLRKAEGFLQAALQEDPAFLDAKVELAELMLVQADVGMRPFAEGREKMSALIKDVLARNPTHPRARSLYLWSQAAPAANNGDYSFWQDAETELRSIVAAAPYDVEARSMLAWFVSRGRNREEAVTILRESLVFDPLNSLLHERLSNALERASDYDAARDAMLRALDLEPDAPSAWMSLGDIALQLGDGVLAIDSYLESQSRDVLDHELPGRAAAFLYSIGLPDEADEYYQRVLAIAPESEDAQNLALLRAVALGEINNAVQIARDIIEGGEPERWTAWDNARQVLIFTSVQRGSEIADIAFMDEHVPDFSNLDKIAVAGFVNRARRDAVDILATTKTDLELQEFSERLDAHNWQFTAGRERFAHVYLDWDVFFGNTDAAMQLALDHVFAKPVTAVRLWKLRFARPFMGEFMSDPRMQEALRRWERQEELIRGDVRDYLAERG